MKVTAERIAQAKDAAVKALAARDLTRAELTEHLVKKRFGPPVAEAALLELEELGVVDDHRVAAQYVERRLAEDAPTRAMLETELLERGIEAGLAATVLAETMGARDEGQEALDLARDRVRRSKPDLTPEVIRRRVYAFLARRGYDDDTCRHAVETAADEYLGRP
jgi:regulatory protein